MSHHKISRANQTNTAVYKYQHPNLVPVADSHIVTVQKNKVLVRGVRLVPARLHPSTGQAWPEKYSAINFLCRNICSTPLMLK